MKQSFNPFLKEIDQIEKNDLKILITNKVSEGWFVEYKSQFSENAKIAKSIASFANTEGGWLIIGVKDDSNNTAVEIDGFDLSKVEMPKERVCNIAASHITPVPFFESKLIKLDDDKAVLIIKIEKSDFSPHVHSDGRIYRRIGETSTPTTENNAHIIEELYKRKSNLEARFKDFSVNSLRDDHHKNSHAFLEIYLYQLPFDAKPFTNFYSFEFAEKVRLAFKSPVNFMPGTQLTSNIALNFFQSSYNSIILRSDVAKESPTSLGLTIEIFENRCCKIFIPLPELIENDSKVQHDLLEKTLNLSKDKNKIKIIDGYSLVIQIQTLLEQCLNLIEIENENFKISSRMRITNFRNKVVYLDSNEYLEHVSRYGLPVSLKDTIEIPSFTGTSRYAYESRPESNIFSGHVLDALGIPFHTLSDQLPNIGNYIVRNYISK